MEVGNGHVLIAVVLLQPTVAELQERAGRQAFYNCRNVYIHSNVVQAYSSTESFCGIKIMSPIFKNKAPLLLCTYPTFLAWWSSSTISSYTSSCGSSPGEDVRRSGFFGLWFGMMPTVGCA